MKGRAQLSILIIAIVGQIEAIELQVLQKIEEELLANYTTKITIESVVQKLRCVMEVLSECFNHEIRNLSNENWNKTFSLILHCTYKTEKVYLKGKDLLSFIEGK